mmetsp:Transcript_48197/g.114680  ORF Transcript_48197/g.114680 Transcript_48197/m.114680 type:complete len:284 (+) Transcript_48197:26-877(+)
MGEVPLYRQRPKSVFFWLRLQGDGDVLVKLEVRDQDAVEGNPAVPPQATGDLLGPHKGCGVEVVVDFRDPLHDDVGVCLERVQLLLLELRALRRNHERALEGLEDVVEGALGPHGPQPPANDVAISRGDVRVPPIPQIHQRLVPSFDLRVVSGHLVFVAGDLGLGARGVVRLHKLLLLLLVIAFRSAANLSSAVQPTRRLRPGRQHTRGLRRRQRGRGGQPEEGDAGVFAARRLGLLAAALQRGGAAASRGTGRKGHQGGRGERCGRREHAEEDKGPHGRRGS